MGVEDRLRNIEHVQEIYGPSLVGRQEVRVMIDPERARALDVDPTRIAETVSFAFRGQRLRRFHGKRGEIEVIVGLPETLRPGLAAMKDLQVPRGDGQFVSLDAVTDVVMARTSPGLNRVNRKTTKWVTLEFDEEGYFKKFDED